MTEDALAYALAIVVSTILGWRSWSSYPLELTLGVVVVICLIALGAERTA